VLSGSDPFLPPSKENTMAEDRFPESGLMPAEYLIF